MKLVRWLSLSLIPLVCRSAEIPEPVLPAGVGVNIHFVTGHQRDLDLIQAAGFKFIRMDFGWASIERRKGEYNWLEYDELLKNLEARGIRPVFILDYSHGLYEETVTNQNPVTHQMNRTVAAPQHDESVAAFSRWAAASARHYQGRHVIWEIWNEPNIQFWSPKPEAMQYAKLALAAGKAIREAEPTATIVGPASSTFPWDFLETVFKSGALQYFDAVSVHPYRNPHRPPETAAADYERLRELIDRYAPAPRRGKIPILSGEWGYSSFAKGVSPETQAVFAVRQQLSNLLNGVPLSIWYDWKNDGSDPNENEDNFGTVLSNLTPKPAYVAIRTLTSELSGYRIVRRLALAGDQDYALLLQSASGEKKLAAWTLSDPHPVNIQLSSKAGGNPAGMRGDGEPFVPRISEARLVLDLTAAPQYIGLGTGAMIGD